MLTAKEFNDTQKTLTPKEFIQEYELNAEAIGYTSTEEMQNSDLAKVHLFCPEGLDTDKENPFLYILQYDDGKKHLPMYNRTLVSDDINDLMPDLYEFYLSEWTHEEKEFLAYWSKDFVEPHTRLITPQFFSTELGYSRQEQEEIYSLKVHEVWKSKDYGNAHIVIRVK